MHKTKQNKTKQNKKNKQTNKQTNKKRNQLDKQNEKLNRTKQIGMEQTQLQQMRVNSFLKRWQRPTLDDFLWEIIPKCRGIGIERSLRQGQKGRSRAKELRFRKGSCLKNLDYWYVRVQKGSHINLFRFYWPCAKRKNILCYLVWSCLSLRFIVLF